MHIFAMPTQEAADLVSLIYSIRLVTVIDKREGEMDQLAPLPEFEGVEGYEELRARIVEQVTRSRKDD